jgi:non-ribosomal peptide synthetase-like protein
MRTEQVPLPAPARLETLQAIFESQAEARPGAVAAVFGEEETRYAQLEEHSNRVARALRARGIGRHSLVALLAPRSIEHVVGMLGILKAGACCVPLDPEDPPARLDALLGDCDPAGLLTAGPVPELRFDGLRLDLGAVEIAAAGDDRLERSEQDAQPRDLAFLFYVSGGNGRPHGVMLEHHNVAHLVRARAALFGIGPDDRVYQGSAPGTDRAVEEIFLALEAGGTLVIATREMALAGRHLARLLTLQGVSVLSTTPTLLALLAGDVPTLRLVLLEGEPCSRDLLGRWSRPQRRLVMVYGVTETCGIAACADVTPDGAIHFGPAVPGARVRIADPDLRPVAPGEVGEICVGGAGLGRGYYGRPVESWSRFVHDPWAPADFTDARVFRTGDYGRIDAHGNLHLLGRADGQARLRGRRVEMEEIERQLESVEGVQAAACAVRTGEDGDARVVAWIERRPGLALDGETVRSAVRGHLPAGMVPALVEVVESLPRFATGSLDRAALPETGPRGARAPSHGGAPHTVAEVRIAALWEGLFAPARVAREDHFFLDLGGHSLLARRMIAELRKDPWFAHATVEHVYDHPTVAALAAALLSTGPSDPASGSTSARRFRRGERRRHAFAGVLQAVGLYAVFAFAGSQAVAFFLGLALLRGEGVAPVQATVGALLVAALALPVVLLLAIAAKWILLGRVRPGRHSLWGWYYVRHWFVTRLVDTLPLDLLAGTPLLCWFYRGLGARIGRDVHLGTRSIEGFDLVRIGDGSSLGARARLIGSKAEDGLLVLGPVRIGAGCFVGTRSSLEPQTRMEDGARLEDLSYLPGGSRVRAGETWSGAPARPASADALVPPGSTPATDRARPRPQRLRVPALAYGLLAVVLSLLPAAAAAPGVLLLLRLGQSPAPWLLLPAAPLAGASFALLLAAEIVLLKRIFVGRLAPGRHRLHGRFYLRAWLSDRLQGLASPILGGFQGTVYLAPWYRALGARIGRSVEISRPASVVPDLLDIADEATIAEGVLLGAARVERGFVTLTPTRVGQRASLGSAAVVPPGARLGDASRLEPLSVLPADPDDAGRHGAAWIGSPARPSVLARGETPFFGEEATYRPSRARRALRASVEAVRGILPAAGFISVITATVLSTVALRAERGAPATLLLMPVAYLVACLAAFGVVVAAKWALLGRVAPLVRPLWSPDVWRLQAVEALYEFLAAPLLLGALRGTPFLPWCLRLLGARIGRCVSLNTTRVAAFDLVEVGDRSALNEDAELRSPLVEDRVLNASRLRIGSDCSVGAGSVLLSGTEMQDGSRLGALSLLRNGETLPAGTSWAGLPAIPVPRSVLTLATTNAPARPMAAGLA